jgi:RNA polymerase sigma factor (sigma-70 family)
VRSSDDWNRLLDRCLQAGDRAARHELVVAAYGIVAAVMAARADAETAKDLTQSVFVKLIEDDWRRVRAFDRSFRVPFPCYLRVIAIRTAIDWGRSRGESERKRQCDLAEVEAILGVGPLAEDRLMERELHAAVGRLPRQQRLAVRLLLEGMTVREIALCLGISASGAGALLWRARESLRTLLDGDP